MLCSIRFLRNVVQPHRWCAMAAIVACLGVSGCRCLPDGKGVDLRGEPFVESRESHAFDGMRTPDRQGKSFAWTNKGMQIDKNFGYGAR